MVASTITDYTFEVFVSYSHSGVVKPWVLGSLVPLLKEWLPQFTAGKPARVFIDNEKIDEGVRWPPYIREALLASKCLVPILSGDYFFKPWCRSEWQSFIRREDVLGLDHTSQSLVFPIIHSDGEFFPARAKEYQPADFSKCRSISPNFQNHANYPVFEEKVEKLAAAIAAAAERAPVFDPTWPVLRVNAKKRTIPLMRIS